MGPAGPTGARSRQRCHCHYRRPIIFDRGRHRRSEPGRGLTLSMEGRNSPWKDETAGRFANEKRALLASTRRSKTGYSLSPQSLRDIPAGAALLLPSPNGSTLCGHTNGKPTFTACLRNASAVAAHVAARARRIAVIPAGERWPDDTLRPCVEDLVGAGAALTLLPGRWSPEAEIAIAAFERLRGDLATSFAACASGKELTARGFFCDIELAAQYDVSRAVPMLEGDRFVDAADPHLDCNAHM
jgi:2-phosphosulfolactate phosphatase